jgi:hypothetical protein
MKIPRPDPLTLYAAGTRNLLDLVTLTCVGQSGELGASLGQCLDHFAKCNVTPNEDTVRSSLGRLQSLKLVCKRETTPCAVGRPAKNWVLTRHGLSCFTLPPMLEVG